MYGAVDFVSGGSVDFTGSTVTGLPAAGATEINDLTDVDTATIAPSRSMQPLIWDDIDSNWYPGNGISLTTNLTMEDNSFIMLRQNAYINFEGSTTDGFDTRLEVVNPTANRTVKLPDADGTLALTTDIPTALSSFSNDLDYAGIVGGAIQANGLPSGTEVTDGIYAKDGQALSIGYKDYSGLNTSIFVDETTGVQFWKDVTFDNVTVDFTTSSIVNTPFAETANLATVATSGDYDDLTNKPTDLVRTTMTSAIDANSFDISNLFAITLQTQTSAVIGATEGTVVIADGSGWDPLGNGRKSMVVYLGGAWREIAAVPGV